MRYFLIEIDSVDELSMREYPSPEECRENANTRMVGAAGPFVVVLSDDGEVTATYIDMFADDDDDD